MKARYIRISGTNQNTARQEKSIKDELVFIDRISGSVPFKQRPQAIQLLKAIQDSKVNYITVSSIDRLGRNTLDVLTTINELHILNVCVFVENLGLHSLINHKESPTFKLIISVLANISEMERTTMLERQKEGIFLAKLKGTYNGRIKGSTESKEKFLSKYPDMIVYLKRPVPPTLKEIAKLCDSNITTVQKVKKAIK